MSKFNLRESLLTLDKETDFEYNLLSDYEAQSFTDEQKKQLVEMIIKKSSVEHISSFLNESIVHMRSEHEFAPLEFAGTLEVGDRVYDKEDGNILTVKDIDKSKKYWVQITFVDENGNEKVQQPGVNYMYEVVGDNDTAYEVDDDIDIEWHSIDDYFNRDIDEDYNDEKVYYAIKVTDEDTGKEYYEGVYDYRHDAEYQAALSHQADPMYGYGNFKYEVIPVTEHTAEMDRLDRELTRLKLANKRKFQSESIDEDTIKTKSGKWVNKGKEGTHGEFKTKKAADAQRRAIWVNWDK